MARTKPFSNLSVRYAKRFTKEYPVAKVEKREAYFTDPSLPGCRLMDGEYFGGPTDIWPAQLDSFSVKISSQHSEREMSYETLAGILLLEKPHLIKRSYTSNEEYTKTLAELFKVALCTLYLEKLGRVVVRERGKLEQSSSTLEKLFRQEAMVEKILNEPKINNRLSFLGGKPNY